jgi:hypothetical protein
VIGNDVEAGEHKSEPDQLDTFAAQRLQAFRQKSGTRLTSGLPLPNDKDPVLSPQSRKLSEGHVLRAQPLPLDSNIGIEENEIGFVDRFDETPCPVRAQVRSPGHKFSVKQSAAQKPARLQRLYTICVRGGILYKFLERIEYLWGKVPEIIWAIKIVKVPSLRLAIALVAAGQIPTNGKLTTSHQMSQQCELSKVAYAANASILHCSPQVHLKSQRLTLGR